MHKPFFVAATLASPVVMSRGYLTLDSLLAAAIFARTGDVDLAHNAIPLKRTGDVAHGSQMFATSGEMQTITMTMRLRNADLEPGAWVADNPKSIHAYNILTDKDDYGSKMSDIISLNSRMVGWFGCGDMTQVQDLLSEVTAIGSKRSQGYGVVEQWDVSEMNADWSLNLHGTPARPMPSALWSELFDIPPDTLTTGMASVALPAWSAPLLHCVLPPVRVVHDLHNLFDSTVA